jgi:hypothetical protein
MDRVRYGRYILALSARTMSEGKAMAKRQSEAVAASLLTSWTDAETAMQIVGTSLGVFGESPLDPTVVLSRETPLRNALFDVLLSLVEGGAVEMRTTGDERYAFRWRRDIAVAGLIPNGSSVIDLAVPSPYLAELQQANAERDAARTRAESAEALAAEREEQLQRVAEVAARASEAPAPAAKPIVRKPAAKKAAPGKVELAIAEAPIEPVTAEPVKAPRRPTAKKAAPKPVEPDIDLTVEEIAPEPSPARSSKWAGYAIGRSRPHLTSVDTFSEDG